MRGPNGTRRVTGVGSPIAGVQPGMKWSASWTAVSARANKTLITRPATGPAFTRVRSILATFQRSGGARLQTSSRKPATRIENAGGGKVASGDATFHTQNQYLARRPTSCYPIFVGRLNAWLETILGQHGACLMGVVNATPDSFFDGGRYVAPDAARAHVDRLLAEGAHVLDVGGESTRPGSTPVPAAEQLNRIEPAVQRALERG